MSNEGNLRREDEVITLVTADTSSYIPAMMATCPGLDSVGTRVWEIPNEPLVSTIESR